MIVSRIALLCGSAFTPFFSCTHRQHVVSKPVLRVQQVVHEVRWPKLARTCCCAAGNVSHCRLLARTCSQHSRTRFFAYSRQPAWVQTHCRPWTLSRHQQVQVCSPPRVGQFACASPPVLLYMLAWGFMLGSLPPCPCRIHALSSLQPDMALAVSLCSGTVVTALSSACLAADHQHVVPHLHVHDTCGPRLHFACSALARRVQTSL